MDFNGQLMKEAGRLVARCDSVNILYHFACSLRATRCVSAGEEPTPESVRQRLLLTSTELRTFVWKTA
jgi:hypothetical protein